MGWRQTCTPYNPLPLHGPHLTAVQSYFNCSHSACTTLGCCCHMLDNIDISSLPTHWCVVDATNVVPLWCCEQPSLVLNTQSHSPHDNGDARTGQNAPPTPPPPSWLLGIYGPCHHHGPCLAAIQLHLNSCPQCLHCTGSLLLHAS